MARLQSSLLSILSILLFVVIYHPTRCNPIQSFRSTSNIVETRTLPDGLLYNPTTSMVAGFSHVLSVMAPNAAAANALTEFYLGLLAREIFEIRSGSREENYIFFTLGPLSLNFVAHEWGKTIPWDFVASFALSMVDWTDRGFLATYDRGYWNLERTLGVYAGLRVEGIVPLQ